MNAGAAALAAALLLTMAGCGRHAGALASSGPGAAGDWPDGVKQAEVYVQVLRRYLGTPAENSFLDHPFKKIFVLDRAVPGVGDPQADTSTGSTIPVTAQRMLIDALADLGSVSFVADRDTVIVRNTGCATVKDGGILITLGPPVGDDNRVEVSVNGFVACLGATWLTYVAELDVGAGWRVTGTTGPTAIA
jgi:hypothetical protein